ncbi:MAG TPA: hypothetical protein VMW38_06080 [Terriglobia bacterium]|nr:hypothetical protein [Terriglobia bacterium]
MPALALVTPEQLRKIVEADGFKVVFEDQYNWWFARTVLDVPFNIPKQAGEDGNVSFAVMENVLFEAHIDDHRYFALKEIVFGEKKLPN